MKYRSDYMNGDNYANRIRALTPEQLQQALVGAKYLRDVLRALGFPPQSYLAELLRAEFARHSISLDHLPIKRRADLAGRRFGHLTALRVGPTLKCGNTTWICREDDTGIEKPVLSKHLLKGTTKSFSFGVKRGAEHAQWTGHGRISGDFWHTLRRGADSRRLVFEITIEQAWDLYLRQDRRCALSGEPIFFAESANCPYTASLDRIDSTRGYTLDNIQWVHTKVNIMKNRYSQAEFIEFCRKVAETHPRPVAQAA